LPHRGPLSVLS